MITSTKKDKYSFLHCLKRITNKLDRNIKPEIKDGIRAEKTLQLKNTNKP